ncbi:hypothetical protein CCO48_26895 [Salmonella enterica subsp. enterica serovar Altendorf]|uniref:fimbrial protein n=1 Tax=Salmonella enterica TaxID=28901 RepID=UPI000BA00200|nr:fimbrial protein [Salmonella enterica]OZU09627.1 hypothetical protein CCO48_26895 [Salmonella enterica subsp. enterica serovar Altendorf]
MSGQMTYLKTTLMVLAMMAGAAAFPVQASMTGCSVTAPTLPIPDISLSSTQWATGKPVGPPSQVTINFTCSVGIILDNKPYRYQPSLVVDPGFKTVVDALKAANLGLNLVITDGEGDVGKLSWDQIKKTGAGSAVQVPFGLQIKENSTVNKMATLTGTFIATEGKPPSVPVNIHVGPVSPAFEIWPVNDPHNIFPAGQIKTDAFNVRLFPSGAGKICISTSGPSACDVNQPNAAVDFGHLYPTSVDSLTRTLPFWVKAIQSVGTTSKDGFDVPLNIEFVSEGETLTAGGQAIKLRNPDKEENGLVLSISGPDGKVTFNQPAPMNISLHFAQSTGDTASQEYLAKVEPASKQAEIKTGRFSAGLTVKVTYN